MNLYNLYPPYRPPTSEYVLTFRDNKEGTRREPYVARPSAPLHTRPFPHLPRPSLTFGALRTNLAAGMELLGTTFTESLGAIMESYLEQRDSIPAFLSAVALAIFDDRL